MADALDISGTVSNAQNAALQASMSPKALQKKGAAATDFESMFLSQMLQPMFAGLSSDENFGGGAGEESFRGMLVNEYGKLLAHNGGVGIASAVRTEMMRLQEHA